MKNIKEVSINTTVKDLFNKWLSFTRPFHKLTNQRQNVLALFLYYHYKFSKEITNEKILWKIVFDYETKKLIKGDLGLSDATLQNIMTYFRQNNIILKDRINPAYMPQLSKDSKNFKIIYNLNIIDE